MMTFFTLLLRGYSMAFKAACYVILAVSVVLILTSGVQNAQALGLRQNSVIIGNDITLGDVFYDLPRDETRVLGAAPRPGDEMVLNARTLLRIALAMDLSWRPNSVSDRVVLIREGSIIDPDEITQALKEKLSENGVNGTYTLNYKHALDKLILPADMPASFEIWDLRVKPTKNWFEADIFAPSKKNPIQRMKVSGNIERMAAVPVMRKLLRKGMVIGKRDIEMIEVPETQIKHNIILSTQDLVGMTPRRMLSPNQPINENDIEAPVIIKRGELVTMNFQSGPLRLTARGKALEDGAKGDVIRIVNVNSNKSIEGEVSDQGEVNVRTF